MANAESMFLQAMEIRQALLRAGVETSGIRPFTCTAKELLEFQEIAHIVIPDGPVEGSVVMIAGIEFYVVPEKAPGFFGVWHEAWQTCCRVHRISMDERERDLCEEQSKFSFYNPHRIDIEKILAEDK